MPAVASPVAHLPGKLDPTFQPLLLGVPDADWLSACALDTPFFQLAATDANLGPQVPPQGGVCFNVSRLYPG